jgi:spore coat polysaccharide biosynthesis protein SpsF
MGSTRLPGKVLLPLGGRPLLERMLARVTRAAQVDDVVVATTTADADEPIRQLAADLGVACVSGHPTDLIERHLQAADRMSADAIVKIPSDCPLIDPEIVDEVVGHYRRHRARYDYVGNLRPATWPDGNDVEVLPRHVLGEAWLEASRAYEREHTTPFVWDRPERYRLGNVTMAGGVDLSTSHRLTIDYEEDYQVIAAVFDALGGAPLFSFTEIVDFLDAHPEIAGLNAGFRGTGWIDKHRHELRTERQAPAGAGRAVGVEVTP